jgi:hypothetical protein
LKNALKLQIESEKWQESANISKEAGERIWCQLHFGSWKEVAIMWRQAYAIAMFFQVNLYCSNHFNLFYLPNNILYHIRLSIHTLRKIIFQQSKH